MDHHHITNEGDMNHTSWRQRGVQGAPKRKTSTEISIYALNDSHKIHREKLGGDDPKI